MKQKTILFFIRSLAKGGAEKQLSLLAVGLSRLGYKVQVLTNYGLANNEDNFNYKILKDANISVLSIDKNGRYDIIHFIFKYFKLIKQSKPDIIYSFLELSNVIACLAKLVIPKVKLVWGKRSSDKNLKQYKLGIRVEHRLERYLSRIPDLIIANSNKGRQVMQQANYKARIEVVVNGITTSNIGTRDIRFELFNKYPVNSKDKLIGVVGRIDPAKDYVNLINAINIVKKQYDNFKLFIVGRDNHSVYAKNLKDLIKINSLADHVFFIPEMEQINTFYASIDLFVSSSVTEGFSNVIGEAMAHGLLCVVTDAGDSKFLVGNTAIVVPASNAQALADGILKGLNKSDLGLGRLAQQRIMELFTVEQMVNNTRKYLEEISAN